MDITLPLLAGTLASMLHVVSGPDHLAAVTPLVIETKHKGWKVGLFWSIGHLIGMLLIGLLFLVFKERISINRISQFSEQLVAIVLIGVGIWVFYRIFNENKTHKHSYIYTDDGSSQHTHQKSIKQNIVSSFGIGIIHGLSGIVHFLILIPALSFKNNSDSLQYTLGIAIGTILAMTCYAFILNKITAYSKEEHHIIFFKGIRFTGGLFAMIIGFYWLYLSF